MYVYFVYEFILSWAFAITLETLIFIWIVRAAFKIPKEKISLIRLIIGGIFATTITIPWVWFVFPTLLSGSYSIAVFVGEVFAYSVEMVFYWLAFRMSWREAFIISFTANTASFVLGFFLPTVIHFL